MGSLIPDRIENNFAQITPEELAGKGIRLVLADLSGESFYNAALGKLAAL